MSADDLPAWPGTYVLILRLRQRRSLEVGALGRFAFSAGFYLYLGSARGAGGLRARLGRHLQGSARVHWHIDYLRRWATPVETWYVVDKRPLECVWRAALSQAGLALAVPGFGASDCTCPGHLFYSAGRPRHSLRLCLQQATGRALARQALPL